ncbi:GntR family transcriptional regulator [Egibacter rhizosphaerae]|uniref:GntR family transcriptional regulator n=2 Tax=Egibacter rhizosphaerae TaxID=1670831 RepID=A0A411YLB9_9ACTN|nr:GntR family transcriptional regulator [Egibacter rhizosphaerae]
MNLRLDHGSPVPLYHQAAVAIEQLIVDGGLPPGAKLESEVELAERLGISRPTMRAALKELVDKGMLVRRRGVGTVVAAVPITRPLALTSLHDDLAQSGRTPTTRVLGLERTPCPAEAREPLGLSEEDEVVDMWRVRYADDRAIALMHNVLPGDLVELGATQLEHTSLYRLLRDAGVELHAATQRLGATAADSEQADRLMIERGNPLVAVTRTTYDTMARPIEYARLLYPADSYEVEMTLVER